MRGTRTSPTITSVATACAVRAACRRPRPAHGSRSPAAQTTRVRRAPAPAGNEMSRPATDTSSWLGERMIDWLRTVIVSPPANRVFAQCQPEEACELVDREHLLAADHAHGQRPSSLARQHGVGGRRLRGLRREDACEKCDEQRCKRHPRRIGWQQRSILSPVVGWPRSVVREPRTWNRRTLNLNRERASRVVEAGDSHPRPKTLPRRNLRCVSASEVSLPA